MRIEHSTRCLSRSAKVTLAVLNRLYWVKTESSSSNTLLDFKGKKSLTLERLSSSSSCEDVDTFLKLENEGDNHKRRLEHSAKRSVQVILSSKNHGEMKSLQTELELLIVPFEL